MTTKTANKSETNLPPLIPRKLLFGNPERTSPKISRDGQYLAYLAPDEKNVLQVWLKTFGRSDDRKLTNDQKRGIRAYFWSYNLEQLIYLQDSDGDENFHLYSVNIKTNEVKDLTPFEGVKAEVVELAPEFPDTILVALNRNNPEIFDVYRLNLINGEVEFDTKNPGNIVSWTANAQFQILAAMAATPDGGFDLLYRESIDKPWEMLRHWDPEDQGSLIDFSLDGQTLYMIASHDANTQRLIALNLDTKEEKVLAEDPQYDVSNVLIHPTQHYIQAVSFNKDQEEWYVLDYLIFKDFDVICKREKGELAILSRDLEDKKWILAYIKDNGPVFFYLYERETKSSTLLFTNQPALEELPLASMKPISYQSRDGLTIHGYLTLPVGLKAPYPTVLLVHGGPWARDDWGYSPTVQWLANRGYAVLQVNYRGSTGYGKAFLNAGNREWAGAMHDDLIDAVNWLIQEGTSDPKKIAIMGGSYGGYATLVGLTFTPDVFACGVDIVGPSSIITLLQSIPPYWKPLMGIFEHRVGNLQTEEEFLKSRSPLFFVDKIERPLLIGQGANDPRVKQAESEQIVEAMRSAGKPVEYVLYPDEGHGFVRPENRMHFFAIAEEFLAKYLGGQFEPVTDVEGHSGIVK